MNVRELTISSVREGLQAKRFSAKEIAHAYLEEIEKQEPRLHAFLSVSAEEALKQAEKIDGRAASGAKLPALAGVPCAVKDAILVQDVPCTAGSRILENYAAPEDATVVRKIREAGGILIGKTNLDEFAMGASTENSAYGPTRNPHDTERVPGGSSGGSAAAVAAFESLVALGSDTGGSIRQPASFCGVVGLKPTYGAVSRYGLIALASSLDQIGPLARTVEDAEILFRTIAGKDPLDATSVEHRWGASGPADPKGLRIGVPKEYFAEGLNSEVGLAVRNALLKLEAQGATLVDVELPHTPYALAAYYVINTSEASSNLARYEGLRYGRNAASSTDELMDVYLQNRGEGFGTEVKRRVMLGTYALSAGYYDQYYLKAQKLRTLLKQDFDKAFELVDVIAGPVTPFLPFKIGERIENPLEMYLVDVYTVPVNLAGLPALSLPVGSSEGGLPIGMQLISPAFNEELLLGIGKTVENLE